MSEENGNVLEAFKKEHCALLALLAHAARQAVDTRTGESVFEDLCSAEPSLKDIYPEVNLLYTIHQVRRALRDRQEGSSESVKPLCDAVSAALRNLYGVLPDPLFLVVAEAEEILRKRHSSSRVLEPYILDLVESIQLVLLQETNSLQRRGASITLRLRDVPPFVL
ncbi:hypothetical protein C3747_104g44 [Trypanosoma cruzi]|uniref:Uncharacterized protein n=2 Tax=Trypanosoma cruzi TaxID=5693 RepID=Q4DHE7_TRYCC|nr:hypothetical protein, conserved [Trypanosoma cruzi]EAN91947.1 hypothetical protein, conserved [Trypanosoma cruzi]PWV07223.1 hypothetical protein C3747_104g44 [Trypanosoma cruzi]RNC47217.1 hypothetical protein TcCL_NonESM02963 [Trypanosoma cruzi]|eukprot:XP_813798.1 hypothetical protein [Trypanosoma cruzi strain CL Brener]